MAGELSLWVDWQLSRANESSQMLVVEVDLIKDQPCYDIRKGFWSKSSSTIIIVGLIIALMLIDLALYASGRV
eukprot:CAMPEP_0184688084 /NCGR_PEP_ID=MMETSP0312-20130426/28523_1 /TAXON_ID=31354 /ORGANISM="Compsopogon coeruleus, Strain SAG 36.94" /LENGTH=72 /DNA_ID=CAMNT_0027144849 /DNA_START=63 /DNA_END=281 /DNA_ORIENTATION=-